jgi:NADH dehydrogenase
VVILGAGFGGLLTALTLAKKEFSGEIVLVDAADQHTYSPWLYEVASAFLSEGGQRAPLMMKRSAVFPIKQIIKPWPQIRFRQGLVSALEVHEQYVLFDNGQTLRYDQLVIALGSEAEFYNIPGLSQQAIALKSFDDALLVRDRVQNLMSQTSVKKLPRVVIGGGGATGVETAAELVQASEGKLQVVLVEAGPGILGPLPKPLRQWAQQRLEELGVQVLVDTTIIRAEPQKLQTKAEEIPFDLFVWTGGVRPSSTLSTWGLPKDARGRIQVDECLRVIGLDNVFALGDNAACIDPNTQKLAPATAWVAADQGKFLGNNLARISHGLPTQTFELPKKYPAVLQVGGRFAIATIGGYNLKNVAAHWLQKMIDLNYFLDIFPFWLAIKICWRSTKVFGEND